MELPHGWQMSTLGSICKYMQRGKTPKYAEASSLPVINQKCIRWSGILPRFLKYIHQEQFPQWTPERFIQVGDILWNSTGTGTIGRASLVSASDVLVPKVVDSHVTILRPNQDLVDSRYLFYWIMGPVIQHMIDDLSAGTTNQIELNRSTVMRTFIPLAPLSEQKRIVDELQVLLAHVDSCRERLDRVTVLTKRFKQALLTAATSGKLTEEWRQGDNQTEDVDTTLKRLTAFKHKLMQSKKIKSDLAFSEELVEPDENFLPEQWTYVNLGSLAMKITDGEHQTPNRTKNGFYLLSARNVTNAGIVLRDVDYVGADEFHRLRKRCDPNIGDVLISCSGSVGRVALVDQNDHYVMVRSAAMVRPLPDFIDLTFLYYSLQSPFCQRQMEKRSKSTAQANLFLGEIKQIVIAYPPLEEQREIVRRIQIFFDYLQSIEAKVTQSAMHLEKIGPAALSQAFGGQLIPPDPNNESASKLLASLQKT